MPEPYQEHYESLREELLEKCNPAAFSDPEMQKKANQIYARLNAIGSKNYKSILAQAQTQLGIRLSTGPHYDYLKQAWALDRFTRRVPYDEKRVEKAIEINQLIETHKNDRDELLQLPLPSSGGPGIDRFGKIVWVGLSLLLAFVYALVVIDEYPACTESLESMTEFISVAICAVGFAAAGLFALRHKGFLGAVLIVLGASVFPQSLKHSQEGFSFVFGYLLGAAAFVVAGVYIIKRTNPKGDEYTLQDYVSADWFGRLGANS